MAAYWSRKSDRIRIEDRGFDTPCHIWQLAKDKDGYGVVRVGSRSDGTRRQEKAHRQAWSDANGPISDGALVNHRCRQHDCTNVEHMELVTPTGNIRRDHSGTKLTSDLAAAVRVAAGTVSEVAAAFGIPYEHARRIRRGERWNPAKQEVA